MTAVPSELRPGNAAAPAVPAARLAPPRFTVVMATLNGEPGLQRALDSIFDQTYPHVELVVMDGGSTDGTLDILRRNEARIAHWESSPDTGIYNAWNKALDHATGDWVCFLGADDWYAGPDVMARVAAWITDDRAAHAIYYGHMDKHHSDGRVYKARERRWTRARRRHFRRGVMFPHPAAFHQRSLFDEFGRFDESFVIAGDFEFLLRILKRGKAAAFMDVVVVNMTAGGISQKPSNRLRIVREVYRARYQNGVARTPAWRSPALYRSLLQAWVRYRVKPAAARARATLSRARATLSRAN